MPFDLSAVKELDVGCYAYAEGMGAYRVWSVTVHQMAISIFPYACLTEILVTFPRDFVFVPPKPIVMTRQYICFLKYLRI